MNRTANYNLCQFEAGDQVQRTDFNEDNAKIDAAIAAEASARQSGDSSLSSRISSLSSTVSGKASQSALNTLKNQVAKLGNCQIHCFTYTGTGQFGASNPTQVTFTKKPLFFYIAALDGFATGSGHNPIVRVQVGSNAAQSDATWSGSRLSFFSHNNAGFQLNMNGRTYYVTAFYAQDQ